MIFLVFLDKQCMVASRTIRVIYSKLPESMLEISMARLRDVSLVSTSEISMVIIRAEICFVVSLVQYIIYEFNCRIMRGISSLVKESS